ANYNPRAFSHRVTQIVALADELYRLAEVIDAGGRRYHRLSAHIEAIDEPINAQQHHRTREIRGVAAEKIRQAAMKKEDRLLAKTLRLRSVGVHGCEVENMALPYIVRWPRLGRDLHSMKQIFVRSLMDEHPTRIVQQAGARIVIRVVVL